MILSHTELGWLSSKATVEVYGTAQVNTNLPLLRARAHGYTLGYPAAYMWLHYSKWHNCAGTLLHMRWAQTLHLSIVTSTSTTSHITKLWSNKHLLA